MVADADAGKRGSYRRSDAVRTRLLDAATTEFADNGFEGASTRAIARRAGAHQPQINYHFDSKESLWFAVMDRLMTEVDSFVAPLRSDPREAVEDLLSGLVRFSAARPELNRIMIKEASAPSERLTWLIDNHVQPRYEIFVAVWLRMREAGHGRAVPVELVYHLVIGAASLLHANAPEVEQLTGIRSADPSTVDAHVDAMIEMFVGD
jgi:TetR/AcrR family transcriptional regulator